MESNTDHEIRRILVALDASPHSRAALEAAAALAAAVHAELKGIFVKDEDLIRMAESVLAHEVRRFPAGLEPSSGRRLERQLQAEARKAEQMMQAIARGVGVAWSFQVAQGNVRSYLLAASEEADLITVGRLGHTTDRTRRFGSTTRALLDESTCPVLILQHGARYYPDVVVLYDGSAAGERALVFAAQITRYDRAPTLTVLAVGSAEETGTLAERAGDLVRPFNVHLLFRAVETFSFLQIASLLQMRREGLLVVPKPLLDEDYGALDLLLTSKIHPVLLVK